MLTNQEAIHTDKLKKETKCTVVSEPAYSDKAECWFVLVDFGEGYITNVDTSSLKMVIGDQ